MKTMKNLKSKAYRVQIGLVDSGHEFENYDSRVVIAQDVIGAMKKVRLRKNCYIGQVEIITRIDKL